MFKGHDRREGGLGGAGECQMSASQVGLVTPSG